MARTKLIVSLCLALTLAYASKLQAGPTSSNPFGLGLELQGGLWPGFIGNVDLSGKYWMNAYNAVDMELGGGNAGISLGADYLWHNYRVFRNSAIPLYYGVGAYANTNAVSAGIRGKIGVDWLFPHTPWEAYVELAPTLTLVNGPGFATSLEGGGRFYFF